LSYEDKSLPGLLKALSWDCSIFPELLRRIGQVTQQCRRSSGVIEDRYSEINPAHRLVNRSAPFAGGLKSGSPGHFSSAINHGCTLIH